ncbi:MAG: hypothetical protein AB7S72_19555 [Draconibacterium sp.]
MRKERQGDAKQQLCILCAFIASSALKKFQHPESSPSIPTNLYQSPFFFIEYQESSIENPESRIQNPESSSINLYKSPPISFFPINLHSSPSSIRYRVSGILSSTRNPQPATRNIFFLPLFPTKNKSNEETGHACHARPAAVFGKGTANQQQRLHSAVR